MATATAAASILTRPTFTLADRIKIQQQTIRDKAYTVIGRLTSVVWEAQRNISGLSQSQPRYANSKQAGLVADSLKPFSRRQTELWASITLDWLTRKDAPVIAISRDQKDLLLPLGLTPLPPIPDPRWAPAHAKHNCPKSAIHGCPHCIAPRIPQFLTGCPVVGDRVTDCVKDRQGRTYGVIHPISECCVMLGGNIGRIRGAVDPADGTHMALVIDDSNPLQLEAYFVGGRFTFGG